MITSLEINNFKSIKHLKISCKKLNIFIGKPNSGKSNIIEALALQSQNSVNNFLNKDIFRYKIIGDLFYDFNINEAIQVITNEKNTQILYSILENKVPENQFHFFLNRSENKKPISLAHDGNVNNHGDTLNTNVHFYQFKRPDKFEQHYTSQLAVPFGDNLPSLLLANSEYKKWVSEFLQTNNLTLTLRPTENDLSVSKFINGEIYSYPYFTISETLQRVIFYNIALKSNHNSILLFDEPESNTFPFYTKSIAESMALDETNQFFITTHNPYLLQSLIEKTQVENLNVCIAEMIDYETKVNVLNESQIGKILDFNSDVFFNFNQILE